MSKKDILERLILAALAEDIGRGDITTRAIVKQDKPGEALVIVKENGILSGLDIFKKTFFLLDKNIKFESKFKNGDRIKINDTVLRMTGSISSILKGERTALNFMAHLSGIASLTAKYVDKVQGTRAKITDTRKTTPLIRDLEKEAVRAGGGVNHRLGLYDMVLIKENHIEAAGSIQNAVNRCRQYMVDNKLNLNIEIETTNLIQVREALSCNVDRIMLDNMNLMKMKEAVDLIAGKSVVEASGGVSLESVRAIAETGVDLISIGALTHSSPSLDFSLLLKGI